MARLIAVCPVGYPMGVRHLSYLRRQSWASLVAAAALGCVVAVLGGVGHQGWLLAAGIVVVAATLLIWVFLGQNVGVVDPRQRRKESDVPVDHADVARRGVFVGRLSGEDPGAHQTSGAEVRSARRG